MTSETSSPPLSPAEVLTRRFRDWEHRARGWDVAPYPVLLEPRFEPFLYGLPLPPPGYDDGRTPGLSDWFLGLFKTRQPGVEDSEPEAPPSEEAFEDILAANDGEADSFVELQVQCPADAEITPELAERILLGLGDLSEPVVFELMGRAGHATLQFAVRSGDASALQQMIEAYVPSATILEDRGRLRTAWQGDAELTSVVVDFGLSRESVLPIRTFRSLALDPLIGVLAPLHALGPQELGLVQVRLQRTTYPWAESMMRSVGDGEGHSFFADAPEMLPGAREKAASPLHACTIRVAARAPTEARAFEIVRSLGRALSVVGDPTSNELLALSNDGYPDDAHIADVVLRRSRRSGMILSAHELAGIVHLPSATVRSPGLRASPRRTKSAPTCCAEGQVVVGENAHRGKTTSVHLPRDLRFRHTYAVGATGTGKSTLLLSLIRQDIEAGRGVGLIDPHGDLVDDVLAIIPEHRLKDVVLFDPADEECPVGFNVLQARTDRERDLLASDLVSVFRRLSTSWGDQMTAVLGNAVMAFLESEDGGTLLDLRRFLVDRRFREDRLKRVRDPAVVAFFRKEFPLLYGRPQAPLLTRLDAFLRPKRIRAVMAQRNAKLDLGSVMDEGRIFLARLAQGAIGEENAYLLGSLLVSKLHQAALSRERIPEAERRDFFLYLDEFHNFVTPSLSSMLSGARKFRVGLVLAHQELRQLGDRELLSAVLTNAATRVCFRLGDDDARKLAEGFSAFRSEDLQNLGVGEAVCRLERADQDCNVRVARSAPMDDAKAEGRRTAIRESSRAMYGMARPEVEAEIARAFEEAEPVPATAAPYIEEERRVETPPPQPTGTQAADADLRRRTPGRPTAVRKSARAEPSPSTEASGGRGGPQHKYLQSLIKHYAEDRGFRATLEAPAEGGGRIDVLLARDDLSVACEISIASTPAQEIENIRKCRRCGVGRVVLVSPERKTLRTVEKLMKAEASAASDAPVTLCTPDEFLTLLNGLCQGTEERERTVLGYRVKTSVRPAGAGDEARRKASVVGTIVGALKRLRS